MPVNHFYFHSKFLHRTVRCVLYKPKKYAGHALPFILVNDGQDLPRMQMAKRHTAYLKQQHIKPFALLGVYCGPYRMQEYGISYQADYLNRGSLAAAYANFINLELLPFIAHQKIPYGLYPFAVAGFSLGGLSAFDLGWHLPQHFKIVGVFSGSLWWRSKPFDWQNPDANRIAHAMVRNSHYLPPIRFWFEAGTKDEKSDRNGNGIIDSIDDTLDLIGVLQQRGYQMPGHLAYCEIKNGRHNLATWAKSWPMFFDYVQNFLP